MKLKSYKFIIISNIFSLIIFLIISCIVSNFYIETKFYNYSDNSSDSVRITMISDLHGREFGQNNKALINKIANSNPDLICLCGDFVDEDVSDEDISEFISLLQELTKLKPVYFSFGNHDLYYLNNHSNELITKIENTGCIILEEDYTDIEVNGKKIRLGGMFDYAFNQQYVALSEWQKDSTYQFLTDFTNTERTKVLMCHRPESFIYDDASLWEIDYVLCGHTHGGLWQIPFVGGIIAPEQGFFPEYDKGEFNLNNIKMIISSGFSGYNIFLRLFNCPEITVIEL